jgi:uncharacterized protein YdeI (YjbR/CyaY-like superfamily)
MPTAREPQRTFADAEAFRAFVVAEPPGSDGVWIRHAKAGNPAPSVSYAEALVVALRHGWIDGQRAGLDADWYLQRWLPRRPRSRWSRVNREKAEALIAAGEMAPGGLAEVERARADGRWDAAYASPSRAVPPPELLAALDALPGARAFFDALDGANRYAILHRIDEAKRPETRARRIEKFAAMCAAGETVHPPRARKASRAD